MQIDITALLLLLGVPSAVTSMGLWLIQRRLTKSAAEQKARDEARQKHEMFMVQCVGASFALGEATALAVQCGKCNGEMSAALEYAKKVKREHRDFLQGQAVARIQEGGS